MLTKIRVSVSRTCEMNCVYCPHGSRVEMENYDAGNQYCMTTDEIIGILKIMRRFGLENVHLTGGEPLHREDLMKLIGLTTSLGMKVELNTNGVGLSAEMVKGLKESGAELLKISLDAHDRSSFLDFTGLDAFERVIEGIKRAATVIPVRLNCVVMKSNFDHIIPALEMCNEMKISQVHLLDLTYYPYVGGKAFWEKEFVYLTKDLVPILTSRFGGSFEKMPIYGCSFYRMATVPDGTTVILKEATPTMRIAHCQSCEDYCHEGVFTLRLSAGGYLNFCPCDNKFGVDALDLYRRGLLDEAVVAYSKVFDSAFPTDSFETFLVRNNLTYSKGGGL